MNWKPPVSYGGFIDRVEAARDCSLVPEIRVGDEITRNGQTIRITQVCSQRAVYAGFVHTDGKVYGDMRIDELAWIRATIAQRHY